MSVFQGFMTGVQAGQAQADRNRTRGAQERAGAMTRANNPTGASQELIDAGLYGDAAALNGVSMTNTQRDARVAAGQHYANGNPAAAAPAFFNAGMVDEGQTAYQRGQDRQVGAALIDDPKQAAAIAAAGGDPTRATQIIDWSRNASEAERRAASERASTMAPLLYQVSALPYEQRRQAISQHAAGLSGSGFSPEQIAAFDPTDGNIKALIDSTLGMEKVLGSYSQREVGDEVRTYNTSPYGVRQVGSEPVPVTRDERRQDERLDLERLRIERQPEINSAGDVLGPVLEKYRLGEALTEGEQSLVDRYLAGGQSQSFGMGGFPSPMTAPAVQQSSPPGDNRPGSSHPVVRAPAQAQAPSGQGTQASPARPRSREEAAALPPGTWFVDPSGNLLQR